jgi:hypothetical protein
MLSYNWAMFFLVVFVFRPETRFYSQKTFWCFFCLCWRDADQAVSDFTLTCSFCGLKKTDYEKPYFVIFVRMRTFCQLRIFDSILLSKQRYFNPWCVILSKKMSQSKSCNYVKNHFHVKKKEKKHCINDPHPSIYRCQPYMVLKRKLELMSQWCQAGADKCCPTIGPCFFGFRFQAWDTFLFAKNILVVFLSFLTRRRSYCFWLHSDLQFFGLKKTD